MLLTISYSSSHYNVWASTELDADDSSRSCCVVAGVMLPCRSAPGQCLHLYNATVVIGTVKELDYMSYM
jgi:hypothetical protein